ncbi:hypothetical protein [Caballeronia sp. Sq4a]|uniref:hypothetical protein n=1 Tax=Caballeronia sp. Sq4a TaxID=2878152 RepID=UPI0020C11DCA|nr:hypothetical protein [Caballeronia sp. Sq4a]
MVDIADRVAGVLVESAADALPVDVDVAGFVAALVVPATGALLAAPPPPPPPQPASTAPPAEASIIARNERRSRVGVEAFESAKGAERVASS